MDEKIREVVEKLVRKVYENQEAAFNPALLEDKGFQPFKVLELKSATMVNVFIELEDLVEEHIPGARFKPGFADGLVTEISIGEMETFLASKVTKT